jgi:hypothetical protein
MINKDTLYEPIVKIRDRLKEYKLNPDAKEVDIINDKLELFEEVVQMFESEEWSSKSNKQRIIKIFEEINDNQYGGLPDEITKDLKDHNSDYQKLESLMGQNCQIF